MPSPLHLESYMSLEIMDKASADMGDVYASAAVYDALRQHPHT